MICPNCNTENQENNSNCIACNYPLINSNVETLTFQNQPDLNNQQTILNQAEQYNNEEIVQMENQSNLEKEATNTLKNPVSDFKEEVLDEHVNLFVLIKLLIGTLLKPGATVAEKTRAYTKLKPGLKIFFFYNTITFIFYMVSNLINSCFVKVCDINTSIYSTVLSYGELANVNYTRLIIIGLLLSYGIPAIITLVYYIASFITNKGLSIGRYFSVITLSLIPLLLSACVVAPIASIFSYYISIGAVIFGVIYSFIILTTTISDLLIFKNTNQKITYHTIILSIIIIIISLIITIFLKDQLNALNIHL